MITTLFHAGSTTTTCGGARHDQNVVPTSAPQPPQRVRGGMGKGGEEGGATSSHPHSQHAIGRRGKGGGEGGGRWGGGMVTMWGTLRPRLVIRATSVTSHPPRNDGQHTTSKVRGKGGQGGRGKEEGAWFRCADTDPPAPASTTRVRGGPRTHLATGERRGGRGRGGGA